MCYEAWYNTKLDCCHVLPIQKAIQGYPKSGHCWEQHINFIFSSPELGFQSTTHNQCIYHTIFEGEVVFLLHQTDDFACSITKKEIADKIFEIIGRKLQLPLEDKPPFKTCGFLKDFNGVNINQNQQYIEITYLEYIDRILC